jgi:hypothetical protein
VRLVAFVALSGLLVALGARLLRSAPRKGAAERTLGLAFALAGAWLWLIPLAASGVAATTARTLVFGVQGGMSVTIALLCRFAWMVFRPDSRIARVLAPLLIGVNLSAMPLLLADGVPTPTGPLALAVMLPRCAVMLWLFFESTHYAQLMRRRVRHGLAEPLVANRFALWAIWTGALALIPLFVLGLRMFGVLEAPIPGEPLPGPWRAVLAVLGAGLACALVAGWFAFFPPAAYRRWVEAGAARPA